MNDAVMSEAGNLSHAIAYGNLREWIEKADALGEVRRVSGASWEEDIGLATELLQHSETAPCALFDDIPGYRLDVRFAAINGSQEAIGRCCKSANRRHQ
jgi:hypothetical protein